MKSFAGHLFLVKLNVARGIKWFNKITFTDETFALFAQVHPSSTVSCGAISSFFPLFLSYSSEAGKSNKLQAYLHLPSLKVLLECTAQFGGCKVLVSVSL